MGDARGLDGAEHTFTVQPLLRLVVADWAFAGAGPLVNSTLDMPIW